MTLTRVKSKRAGKRSNLEEIEQVTKPKRKNLNPVISSDIISLLIDRGYSKAKIAEFLGKSLIFVDGVINKERNLSIEDLKQLEKKMSLPIMLLLLRKMKTKKPSSKNKELFEEFYIIAEKILESTSRLRGIPRAKFS